MEMYWHHALSALCRLIVNFHFLLLFYKMIFKKKHGLTIRPKVRTTLTFICAPCWTFWSRFILCCCCNALYRTLLSLLTLCKGALWCLSRVWVSVKGNCNAAAYRDLLCNCLLPSFGEEPSMGGKISYLVFSISCILRIIYCIYYVCKELHPLVSGIHFN